MWLISNPIINIPLAIVVFLDARVRKGKLAIAWGLITFFFGIIALAVYWFVTYKETGRGPFGRDNWGSKNLIVGGIAFIINAVIFVALSQAAAQEALFDKELRTWANILQYGGYGIGAIGIAFLIGGLVRKDEDENKDSG